MQGMTNTEQAEKVAHGAGFVAALDQSGGSTPKALKLYGVDEKDVLFTPYEPGHAFKATIPRLVTAGDIGDTDVYGAQQHAPLLDVEVPI